jgi:AAA family ATP:ADP antiporter
MAEYQRWLGVTSIILMLLGAWMMRRFSWVTCALASPVLMGSVGIIFFGMVAISPLLLPYFSERILLTFAVTVGFWYIVLSKSLKFSFFDATKERAYIPLTEELKTKGKAAVDVLGERVGKSGCAFLQTMLFTIFPLATYHNLAPLWAMLFLGAIALWYYATGRLGTKFMQISQNPPC